ncbi:hypothetical protein GGI03_006186 [Coemansia sp. RSA 2337]|nr:hypothetical protein GGH13_009810 [Coemansia sp. S155-1]KAJ2051279.1 hypothetical protein H4S04_002085 [Coemansia sp. S16]KAJ2052173.1 hypothetical protein GGI08_005087 [Coemansia sp. S2]KAJ2106903.1 hypothetical protein IW146_007561 [Coemansia sp. RSA 922]KAJ2457129.1 hypothetical protein GGI03_006186 [Coemansia sp. RSA 2337]
MLGLLAARSIRAPVIRLAQGRLSARRFASNDSHHDDDHHHKAEEENYVFEEEDFSNPLWKYAIGGIGLFYLIGKYDDYIEKSGRVHPMTMFYASIMTDKAENRRIFTEYQKEVAKVAEFNILQWEEKPDMVASMNTAEYYKRGAKWGTPIGIQVDMSGAKHRTPIKE